MTFQPTQESMTAIVNLLQDSGAATTNEQHRIMQQKLIDFNANPEFNLYLAYILTQMKGGEVGEPLRQLAGLLLKNNIRNNFDTISPPNLNYIKGAALADIGDASPILRSTIGTVLTEIVASIELETWPELLPALAQHLDNPDMNFIHGKCCFEAAPTSRPHMFLC